MSDKADKIRAIYKYRLDSVIRIFGNSKLEKQKDDTWYKNNPDLIDLSYGLYRFANSRVSQFETWTVNAIEAIVFDLLENSGVTHYVYESDACRVNSYSPYIHNRFNPISLVVEEDGIKTGYYFEDKHARGRKWNNFIDNMPRNIDAVVVVVLQEFEKEDFLDDTNQFNKSAGYPLEKLTLKQLFEKWFDLDSYNILKEELDIYREKAIEAIGLNTVLKPTVENIISIVRKAEREIIDLKYAEGLQNRELLSADDMNQLKNQYVDQGYYKFILGNEEYADSFVASEWMLEVNDLNGGLDYTGVVSGYLKSVEQLLKAVIKTFIGERLFYEKYDKSNETYETYSFVVSDSEKTDSHLRSLGNMLDIIKDDLNKSLLFKNDQIKRVLEEFIRDWCKKRNKNFHSVGVKDSGLVHSIRYEVLCIYFLLLGGINLNKDQEKQLGERIESEKVFALNGSDFVRWLEYMPERRISTSVKSLRFVIVPPSAVLDSIKWQTLIYGYEVASEYEPEPGKGYLHPLYSSGVELRDFFEWEDERPEDLILEHVERLIQEYVNNNKDLFDCYDEVLLRCFRYDELKQYEKRLI